MSLTIQLTHFEGPLALLLYLIRKEEMDIMDIKIHEITGQYLEYIKLMKELDIEVAGEFVAMAATLIQIKSRMLLPQYGENGEIIEAEDPRKELVQKLLEYQKYQEASKLLYERPLLGRDVWARGFRERLAPKEEEIELEENALFSLITSYRKIIKSAKKRIHRVAAKTLSIAGRIRQMRDRLIVGTRVTLMELVEATEDRARATLITFLSLLELGKMGFVGLSQLEPYADLWIETKRPIENDVIGRVEEYENVDADMVAAQLALKLDDDPAIEAPADDFVLTDAEDVLLTAIDGATPPSTEELLESLKENVNPEEMATDDDIFAAEEALSGHATGASDVFGGPLVASDMIEELPLAEENARKESEGHEQEI